MATCHNHIIIAAIDFGTTYSGYAFSTLDQLQKDPTKIFTVAWNPAVGKNVSLKTPTCVLFKEDKTFHSCGFKAEAKYVDLAFDEEKKEHEKWYYFRRFKMILYDAMVSFMAFHINVCSAWHFTSMFVVHGISHQCL